MAISAGDKLRCAARQILNTRDDHFNVFHLQVVTAPTPNDDASALEDISFLVGAAFSNLAPYVTSGMEPETISVYNITDDRPIGVTSWGGGYVGGANAGEILPPDDALLVLLDTGVKRRQGRFYFGGLAESVQNEGVWNSTARNAAAAVPADMTALVGTPWGGEYNLVVWSPTDGVAYPIYGFRAQPLVADMPSRKTGRGS